MGNRSLFPTAHPHRTCLNNLGRPSLVRQDVPPQRQLFVGDSGRAHTPKKGVAVQYTPLASNPFAVLTAVVAPAILTNASSVLALGTSNRLARVVDRTRVVAAELSAHE